MKFATWTACAAAATYLIACGGSEAPESASTAPPPPAEKPAPAPEPAAQQHSAETSEAPAETPVSSREFPRPAPELSFRSIDGRQVSLSDLKGKAVLVMFFSTDCPHCQRTAEVLAPIYAEMKPQGVEVLALAMNPNAQTNLRAFAEKYRADYPVSTASRQEFARFAGLSVMSRFYYPYLLFVDPEGNLIEEHQGSDQRFFADLDASLRSTFEKLLES